jgi:hypothetical protein
VILAIIDGGKFNTYRLLYLVALKHIPFRLKSRRFGKVYDDETTTKYNSIYDKQTATYYDILKGTIEIKGFREGTYRFELTLKKK